MSKEGIIPIPKIGTNVLKKIIKLAKKSLLMTIHESDYSTTIYIGGYTKYCIEAQIMKHLSKQDITVGAFNKIRFDVECSLEHDFTRGYDTTMILKLLFDPTGLPFLGTPFLLTKNPLSRYCPLPPSS